MRAKPYFYESKLYNFKFIYIPIYSSGYYSFQTMPDKCDYKREVLVG